MYLHRTLDAIGTTTAHDSNNDASKRVDTVVPCCLIGNTCKEANPGNQLSVGSFDLRWLVRIPLRDRQKIAMISIEVLVIE